MADNKAARESMPTEMKTLDWSSHMVRDGFDNITRAMNTAGLASVERSGFQTATLLDDYTLTSAYRQSWLAQDAVKKPAVDITRAWWAIKSEDSQDDADLVAAWIEDVGMRTLFKEAITWSRLYGGGAIVLGVDDGQEPNMPVRDTAIREIRWARVVDRRYIHILMRNRDSDSWDFGKPLLYTVGMREQGTVIVHADRVLPFIGEPLPDDFRDEVNGWGDSVLERSWDPISRYNKAGRSLTIACERFIQSTFKVKDLSEYIANDGGAELALKRLQMLNMGLFTGNIAMIDSVVEEFVREGLPMTGLHEAVAELRKDVAGATKRPESQIFGQQQGTTRTGAAADQATYFADIRSQAEEDGEPQLRKLVNLVSLAKQGPINGRGFEFSLVPGELAEQDPETEAKTLKLMAEATKMMIESGAVYPSEARAALTGEDKMIVPSEEVTAKIEEDEMADDFDDDKASADITGTGGDAETDGARPSSYRMADVGGAMCNDCAFRRDAKGSPWCESFGGMVSDAYTCASFKL